jgi:endonuclease G
MRFLILGILIFLRVTSFSQDTVRIKNKSYTSLFSKSLKYPILVEWWVTKAKVTCTTPLKRIDNFYSDPKLSKDTDLGVDYKNSGLDRGHMSPAADNLCEGPNVLKESFYFSNMSPQYHALNAGDWKTLETLTREIAKQKDSVMVWAGNIGSQKKIGRVSVPTKCWKVIYIKRDNLYQCYIFNNIAEKQTGIVTKKVTLEEIEKITGFKFSL